MLAAYAAGVYALLLFVGFCMQRNLIYFPVKEVPPIEALPTDPFGDMEDVCLQTSDGMRCVASPCCTERGCMCVCVINLWLGRGWEWEFLRADPFGRWRAFACKPAMG